MSSRSRRLADLIFFNRYARPLSERLADYLVTKGRHRKERDADKRRLAALSSKLEQLQQKIGKLSLRNKTLKDGLAAERQHAQEQYARQSEAIDRLERRHETLEQLRSELHHEHADLEKRHAVLQRRYAEMEKRLAAEQRRLETVREQRAALRAGRDSDARGFQETIDILRRQRGELQEQRSSQASVNREIAGRLRALRKDALPLQLRASLVDAIARGTSLQQAAIAFLEANFAENRLLARSFCQSLLQEKDTRALGHLLSGIYYHLDGFPETALDHFVRLGTDVAQALCPYAFFSSLMEEDPGGGGRRLRRFLDESDDLPASERARLLNLFAKHLQFHGLRERVAHELASSSTPIISAGERRQLEWLLERLSTMDTVATSQREVSIALMDYKLPDRQRTSSNKGDYVQTLAVLANLCRFADVDFDDGGDLGRLVRETQQRLQPDRRIHGVARSVGVVTLDRDFASGRNYARPTWLIANGWFMHRSFHGDFDFPFPEHIRPIFLSFHVNNPDVLTPSAVDYLRKHEPIGCRDWNTVYRLRDFDIAAFFSGCLTTTIGQIFPPHRDAAQDRLAVVEAALEPEDYPGWSRTSFIQYGDEVREGTLAENLEAARAMLTGYLDFSRVVTSRLHCYLPCRSLGLPVDFRPRNRADVRFEGLLDLGEEEFARMRERLEEKLEAVLTLIFSGADEASVRARWAELCAPDLAEADRYTADVVPLPAPSFDVEAVSREVCGNVYHRGAAEERGNEVHVAFALDRNMASILPVTMASMCEHSKANITAHILSRDLPTGYVDELHHFFPQLRIRRYDFSGIDYGDTLHLLPHTTVSTIDRLLLPELLSGLGKVLYLDIDVLVQADVADLFRTDLGDAPLAAKLTRFEYWKSGARLVGKASLALDPERAWDLRRRLHKQGSLAFPTFNAGVILMNLARMRRDDFSRHHIPLVERYAMNDQDALNVYARSEIVVLGEEWNYVPAQDYCDRPKIIHWAGQVKPWGDLYVLDQEKFRAYADRYRLREDYAGPGKEDAAQLEDVLFEQETVSRQ